MDQLGTLHAPHHLLLIMELEGVPRVVRSPLVIAQLLGGLLIIYIERGIVSRLSAYASTQPHAYTYGGAA